jgi:hypothetical protein
MSTAAGTGRGREKNCFIANSDKSCICDSLSGLWQFGFLSQMWTFDDSSYIVRLAGAMFDLTTLNMKIPLLGKSKYMSSLTPNPLSIYASVTSDDF